MDMEHISFLTEKETAAITRKALSTLRNDRHLRRGIPYIKTGASVRYKLTDVLQYMDSRRVSFEPSDERREGET